MKLGTACAAMALFFVAGCDHGPDAVVPPPWHPASAAAPSAPPIEAPEILDEPVDVEPVKVRQEPAAAPKKRESPTPAPKEGGHGAH